MPVPGDTVLSDADRAFWDANGYVVVRDAVPKAHASAAADAIFEFLDVGRDRADAWYRAPFMGAVELYHHQTFWDNRQFPRLYRAFTEIWGRDDLWVSIDRANMTPPDNPPAYRWNGALHWDLDTVEIPMPLRVQGVLYLADTAENQGGFRCVPGFHRVFEEWVQTQPPDRSKWQLDLSGWEERPIAAAAGDLVIWNSLLPHGNGPNHAEKPRLAQYISMYPPVEEEREWRVRSWRNSEPRPPRAIFPGDPRGWEQRTGPARLTDLGRRLLGIDPW